MLKHVNLVDLLKSFPTAIDLQKSASIQPRTSLTKSGDDSIHFFIRLLSRDSCAAITGDRRTSATSVGRYMTGPLCTYEGSHQSLKDSKLSTV